MKRLAAVVVLAACHPVSMPPSRPVVIVSAPDAPPPMTDAPISTSAPEVRWLKGNTHFHAAPSGDSQEPIPNVLAWYQRHGYDFVVQTDHNRVTDVDKGTPGRLVVHDDGLLVIAGSELTYNPDTCDPPPPEPDGKCRIHLNLLGVHARPRGKFNWPQRDSVKRIDQIARAYLRSREWGGLVQINHPSWHWGAFPELLEQASALGVHLFEIGNAQFAKWNAGDATHPALDTVWDEALTAGATLYGVASDDAHDYDDATGAYAADKDTDGFYPAGGGWVVVHAARDAQSILDALAAGDFYASSGVTLADVRVDDGALVVEIAAGDPGTHTITFIGDGKVLAESTELRASQPLDAASYVRAVVTRDDGARAWVQPHRR